MSNQNNLKTRTMVQLGILSAIIAVMSFTPLGYLRTLGLSITFLPIPVAVGAILMGKKSGAFLGGVFGLMSILQCFGFEPFGTMLMNISPLSTVILCLVPRIIAGYVSGFAFEIINRNGKIKNSSFFISSLLVALVNTLIFVPMFVLLFNSTDFFASLNPNNLNMISFMVVFVGFNGVVESIAALIGGGIISKSVYNIVKKRR